MVKAYADNIKMCMEVKGCVISISATESLCVLEATN